MLHLSKNTKMSLITIMFFSVILPKLSKYLNEWNDSYIYLFLISILILCITLLYNGLTFYKIENQDTIITIRKRVKWSFVRNENYEPSGLFFGYWYLGYIHQKIGQNSLELYLYCICNINTLEELKKINDIIIKSDDKIVNVIELCGTTTWDQQYVTRSIPFNMIAHPNQKEIMEDIIQYYKENNVCVAMISGEPNCGKSTIGWLIAQELNGIICEDYNPTIPGHNLLKLINSAESSKEKPLIVMYNEFDVSLELVHSNKVKTYKDLITEIYNKTTWNTFFDRIERKMRPNLILIMTSNKTREDIIQDESYLRDGRISTVWHM